MCENQPNFAGFGHYFKYCDHTAIFSYSLPEIHGHLGIISVNYLCVRLRRIEWQALRG